MEKYGLIGYPLGHSFSATYFTEKFDRENIDARYDNYEMQTIDDLLPLLHKELELRGLNVTIPHKQAVMPLLDDISDTARAIGAVNVIRIRRNGSSIHLKGYNSDVIGFCQSIRPLLHPELHRHALVLGTGGASKAIVYGLQQMGLSAICVSRTPADGRLTYADINAEIMETHKVIVNCTPAGMYPQTETCPSIPYNLLTPSHLLYDLVYNPLETKFMHLGAKQGATVKNGLEMLHLQAEAGWNFWHT